MTEFINPIFLELLSLSPSRLQAAWSFKSGLVLEIYNPVYKKLYLITDYSTTNPTFHVQQQNPQVTKISSKLTLALRKHTLNYFFTFSLGQISNESVQLNFLHPQELKLIFDFSVGTQIALFLNTQLIAQAHANSLPVFHPHREFALADSALNLNNNFLQSKSYNILSTEQQQYDKRAADDLKLKQQIKKLSKLKKNLELDLENFVAIIKLEHTAELLRVNLHRINKGDSHITVIDYTLDPPAPIKITLDPKLNASRMLQNIFTKIKKARRGITYISPRIIELETQLSRLKETGIADESNYYNKYDNTLKSNKSFKPIERLPYRVFLSVDNTPIWVGKSARDNDKLSLHHARGKEWWFHVRDGAGSHVVVKCSDDALKAQIIVDAGLLAAHFSSHKYDKNPEITYTRIKHIRKPKNFPAGKILIEQEKSFILNSDEKRLKELLNN
jgi:predicted ribosome quality control (RQC) complex YloA/Tae2 family protein